MKKNISRRVMSAVLGAALLVSSGVPVYASGTGNSDVTLQVETGEEPSIVSVKVPTEIPLKMDKEGVVTVPQDLKITNLSDSTDVELTGLSVTGKDSWVVKDYSEDLSSKSEGTKELSMSFRGDGTTSTGDVSLTKDSWVVNRSSELLLNVSAKLPKQGSEYKEKGSIAQVNYTFSVKDEPTDPVEQFTVNYVAGENGSVNESSRSFSKGSSLTFPTTTPSEGYVFDKWVDSSTELEVTDSTTVNANMTVKALFKLDDSGEPIESTISNDWSKDKVIKDSTTPVTFNYDSTSPDTYIVSVESDNTAITVEKAVDTYSLGNPGSEIWNVKAVGKGSATVTATLNTGETTQFVVKVYELNVDGGGDITIEVPDLPDKGPGDNINTGDIVIDIPITTPDGDDTITVTPEIPEDTPPLEEGENNINASVTIDNITINITIVINIEGSGSDNPSDGLHQTIEEAQAMGFTFSSYGDGLQIDSFENKQFKSEINVPEQIGDFKVLKIGDDVFSGQSNLKKITVPSVVNYIGKNAFKGCTGITEFVFPESLKTIYSYAFQGCTGLTHAEIPDSVTNMYGNSFSGCTNLKYLVIPNITNEFRVADLKLLPSKELKILVKGAGNKVNLNMKGAHDAQYIKEVEFSEGCSYMGVDGVSGSFFGVNIDTLIVPSTIPKNNLADFMYCDFENVIWRNKIVSLGNSFKCNIQNLIIDTPKVVEVGNYAICKSEYTHVKNIVITNKVQSIPTNAFDGYTGTITIQNNEDSIPGAPWGATNANIVWEG